MKCRVEDGDVRHLRETFPSDPQSRNGGRIVQRRKRTEALDGVKDLVSDLSRSCKFVAAMRYTMDHRIYRAILQS